MNINNKPNFNQNKKPTGLGKGLSALLGNTNVDSNNQQFNNLAEAKNKIVELDIKLIESGKYQPRSEFKEEALQELSISIQQKGILQPILVRKHPSKINYYEIVAGERRWRASKLAGLNKIPAIIVNFTDKESLEVGLIENLQRQNLNPIEEARAFEQLIQEFEYTHNDLSVTLGKDRSYITNYLRILSLAPEVQQLIQMGKITVGHAKIIVGYEYPIELADKIIRENLSVRETENLVKQAKASSNNNNPSSREQSEEDSQLLNIAHKKVDELFTGFETEVKLAKNGSGYIKIKFNHKDKLKNLLS